MIELKLESFSQLQHLFMLLKLPGADQELDLEYTNLMDLVSKKDRAGQRGKFELAAQIWQKEMVSISRIIDLLNARGIFQKNVLKIKIKKYKPQKIKFK